MNSVVLDTSALIACLKREAGYESVMDTIHRSLISSVNLAETMTVLVRDGMPPDRARLLLEVQEFEIADFDRALAEETGALIGRTRAFGLSLGDRACLALALREKLPALTADRAWRGVDVGVEIKFMR